MTRPAHEVSRALELVASGLNDCEVSRRLGIPRQTIRGWRTGGAPGRSNGRPSSCHVCDGYRFPIPGVTEFAYAHLLGLYLGDGCVSLQPSGVFTLRVFLDRVYPLIIEECVAAISILAPYNRVSVFKPLQSRMDVPTASSRH